MAGDWWRAIGRSRQSREELQAAVRLRVALLRLSLSYGVLLALPSDVELWRELIQRFEERLGGRAAAAEFGLPDLTDAEQGDLHAWFCELETELGSVRDPLEVPSPDEREMWREALEFLEESARVLEEHGTEPLGELNGHTSEAGERLLAGIEDSLTLSVAGTAAEMRMSSLEVHSLVSAADRQGVWGVLG
jgi:hypothetical protein